MASDIDSRQYSNADERSYATQGDETTGWLQPQGRGERVVMRYRDQMKLSINIPVDLGERVRALAFEHRLSGSSIVQVALQQFFARRDDTTLGTLLRQQGASLRRR